MRAHFIEAQLNDETQPRPDWIHLPPGVEVRSLWEPLHDSTLAACESDLLNRTVKLTFAAPQLVPSKPDMRFEFLLSKVSSARATINVRWPGKYVRPSGISRDDEEPLIKEFWSKWREQSLGWTDFEAGLQTNSLDVADASLATGRTTRCLQIGGMLDGDLFDDLYCEVYIAFTDLSIRSSENVEFTLDAFDQLGVTYWDDFGKGSPTKMKP